MIPSSSSGRLAFFQVSFEKRMLPPSLKTSKCAAQCTIWLSNLIWLYWLSFNLFCFVIIFSKKITLCTIWLFWFDYVLLLASIQFALFCEYFGSRDHSRSFDLTFIGSPIQFDLFCYQFFTEDFGCIVNCLTVNTGNIWLEKGRTINLNKRYIVKW